MDKLFNLTFSGSGEITTSDQPDDFRKPRGWQEKAFRHLMDEHLIVVNAPMGSGKSWLMCLLSSYKMQNEKALKCIIGVPQTIIAPGFTNEKIQIPDGEEVHWMPEHNLCLKEPNEGTVAYTIKWLETISERVCERALLCTHATLVKVYKKLKTTGRRDLLSNLLLWVDEAHHITIGGNGISNGIGEVVEYLANNSDLSSQVGLTTATYFRGDRQPVLTEVLKEKFKKYELPYDTYLEGMEHLESFSYDFVLCGPDYTDGVKKIIQTRRGKDIVYIPHPISNHSTGNKRKEVDSIIASYQDVYGGELTHTSEGISLLNNTVEDFRILDLVNEERRPEQKKFIASNAMKERDSLDAIIALGMFQEGANWIHADRCIIVGTRASLVNILQMLGRLLRDAKGKKHVEVIQLLPFSLDQQSNDFCDNLNDFIKTLFVSLLLEDVLKPVTINLPVGDKKEQEPTERTIPHRLSELLPDASLWQALVGESARCILDATDVNASDGTRILPQYEDYKEKILPVFEEFGIEDDKKDAVARKLWKMHTRRSIVMCGVNVENIDFNIVENTHPLDWMLRSTTRACGIDTFQKLRNAIQTSREPLTIDLITDWIGQYIEKHRKQPNRNSGSIAFAPESYEGITWPTVDAALKNGSRGLPGGSSLADLIQEKFGIMNPANLPPLIKDMIVKWVTQHIAKHGEKPLRSSGPVEFATDDYEGITWAAVDSAFKQGSRGLPCGSSLASFIEEEFGIVNPANLVPLTEEMIVQWVTQYIEKSNKKPSRDSGVVDFAVIPYEGITWALIDAALKGGSRGLPEGSSLTKLIEKKFGIRGYHSPPPLPKELIISWVEKFIEKYGRKPTKIDRVVEFADREHNGITWGAIDMVLWRGDRGFVKGSSLAGLIQEALKIRSQGDLVPLTIDIITSWISKHIERYQEPPKVNSGLVEFSTEGHEGIKWSNVQAALFSGLRGLPGGSSLAALIQEKFGIMNPADLPSLSEKIIVQWVEQHIAKYERKPKQLTGVVEFASGGYKGITWLAINTVLDKGGRGFSGGSSLAELIKKKFGIQNRADLPDFSEEKIIQWIQQYFQKYGKSPTNKSKLVEFAEEEHRGTTWGAIDSALSKGARGLPGGSTLSQFIKEELPSLSGE